MRRPGPKSGGISSIFANFRSRGSSANNHVIAEAAGLFVSALAFDWFAESPRWRDDAAHILEEELKRNTFQSGVNREMAFDYHGFVLELAVVAAVEAEWARHPLSDELWALLARMFDVIAATVDVTLRAPRYGDGDDGRALVLDAPTAERWPGLLAIGEALFETPPWWPTVEPTVTSSLVTLMSVRRPAVHPDRRPNHYEDAGLTLLRSRPFDGDEIWCRCDAGPLGYLSIAAHGHADALAVEVRHNGTDVLADPGTYCYHGEPGWRSYFRSTLAHNTVEVAGRDQSIAGGPFLWTRHARSTLLGLETDADGEVTAWSAEHDGYLGLTPPLRHRRSVRLVRRVSTAWKSSTTSRRREDIRSASPSCSAQPSVPGWRDVRWRSPGTKAIGRNARPCRFPTGVSWTLTRGADRSRSRLVLLALRGETADVDSRRRGRLQRDRLGDADHGAAVRGINPAETSSHEYADAGRNVMAVDTGTSPSPLPQSCLRPPRSARPRLRIALNLLTEDPRRPFGGPLVLDPHRARHGRPTPPGRGTSPDGEPADAAVLLLTRATPSATSPSRTRTRPGRPHGQRAPSHSAPPAAASHRPSQYRHRPRGESHEIPGHPHEDHAPVPACPRRSASGLGPTAGSTTTFPSTAPTSSSSLQEPQAEIDEHLQVDPQKIRLIYEAVDHDIFKPGDHDSAKAHVAKFGVARPFVLSSPPCGATRTVRVSCTPGTGP